jgi:hypothetical protein
LREDLLALGDLYLTVFWMFRQRLKYGPRWQVRCYRPPEKMAATGENEEEREKAEVAGHR